MRNAALIVGAVLAVLVVLAVAVPALIDWSRYKGEIIARAEAATGRKVIIAGPISVRLLPSPALSAEGLAVGNPPGAPVDQPMAQAERLRLRLALLPLLTGKVQITQLELDRPVVRLARMPDGRPNWSFDKEPRPSRPAEAERPHSTNAEPPPAPAEDDSVPVDRLVVNQGTLAYEGKALEAIDGEFTIGGRTGPFLAKGEATLAGTPLGFDAAMDRLAPGRGSPTTLTLYLPGDDARLDFSGLVTQLSGGETLRGRLTAASPDLARTLQRLGVATPLPAGQALAAEGELSLSAEEASASNLVLSLGETRATGALTADLGERTQVDVRLAVAALDLDKWTGKAGPASSAAREDAPAPSARPQPAQQQQQEQQQRQQAAPGGFSLPRNLFVTAALSVDALSWRGQVVREAVLQGALDDGELIVNKASAQLPGGSTLSADGTLTAERGRPAFDGSARLRSDNLRALLAWAGAEPSGVPEDKLRGFEFSSPLKVSWPEIRLSDFRLRLDGAQARGALSADLADRPAFGLDATVDTLNLDAYRAQPAKPAAATEAQPLGNTRTTEPAEAPAAKTAQPTRLDGLAGFDADVKLRVQRLVVNEVPADSVTLDALLQAGQLTLRQAAGTLGGAQARVQGRVLDLAASNPRVENLSFQVASPQPARLMRFFGAKPPELVERLGPLNASGAASGTADQLAVEARAEAGGLELNAKGSLAQLLASPSARLTLRARHASTAQVIRLFSPGYRPQGTVGAFALDGQLAGDGDAVTLSDLTLSAGAARLTGLIRAELGGAKPQLTADLAGNALALDPFLAAERTGALLPGGHRLPPVAPPQAMPVVPAGVGAPPGSPFSREPLELGALNGFDARIALKADQVTAKGWRLDQPVAQLAVLNGTASLDQFTGKLLGGDLRATARLAGTGTLAGQLSVVGADLGAAKLGGGSISVTQGRFNLDTRFTTSGRSTQEMASRLAGDGRLLVSNGLVEGFDLPAVNQRLNNIENVGSLLGVVQAGLSGGKTPFSQLAGTFQAKDGVVVSRDLKLDAQGGSATAETVNDLGRWTTQTRIAFALANAPNTPLGIRFEGPLDNPRKIVDVNALQQYLVSKGLGRALKGKDAESILQGLFGKPPPPPPGDQPQPQQEQSQQPPSGKEILKDLLKGLGGR